MGKNRVNSALSHLATELGRCECRFPTSYLTLTPYLETACFKNLQLAMRSQFEFDRNQQKSKVKVLA